MNTRTHQLSERPTTVAKVPPSFCRSRLTFEARIYSVKELARRAGVTREFFDSWTIDADELHTTISLTPDCQKIYFEHLHDGDLGALASGKIPVGRSPWPQNPRNTLLDSDLLTPFARSEPQKVSPLFQRRTDGSFLCQIDLLLSLLFTLNRVEESLCDICDEHGRFPSSASLARQHNFLERPIVDEYGLAFEQVIQAILPAWQPRPRALRVNLTHDIDDIGIPFQLSTTIAHTVKRRRPVASLQDLSATFSKVEPAELAQVRRLAAISKSRGLVSSFFWKATPRTTRDSGYDIFHPKVQRIIADIRVQGCNVGVHPGYDTYQARPKLFEEVQRLRQALGAQQLGGRQHYLRWSPDTWRDWEACNLHYDSSVGFADHFGFRAGTALPFRPWSFVDNRELDLVEVPLILMDCTPVKYMSLPKQEAITRIRQCINRTALVGGVFTLLWHNTPLLDPAYRGWYESILDLLPSACSFDVPGTTHTLW